MSPKGPPVRASRTDAGLRIELLKQTVVLPWSQFLYTEGDDAQVRLTFSTHEVTVKGSGLSHLLSDIGEERVVLLAEPGRAGRFVADTGPRITGVSVRKTG
jgi:hypothetical protein